MDNEQLAYSVIICILWEYNEEKSRIVNLIYLYFSKNVHFKYNQM